MWTGTALLSHRDSRRIFTSRTKAPINGSIVSPRQAGLCCDSLSALRPGLQTSPKRHSHRLASRRQERAVEGQGAQSPVAYSLDRPGPVHQQLLCLQAGGFLRHLEGQGCDSSMSSGAKRESGPTLGQPSSESLYWDVDDDRRATLFPGLHICVWHAASPHATVDAPGRLYTEGVESEAAFMSVCRMFHAVYPSVSGRVCVSCSLDLSRSLLTQSVVAVGGPFADSRWRLTGWRSSLPLAHCPLLATRPHIELGGMHV